MDTTMKPFVELIARKKTTETLSMQLILCRNQDGSDLVLQVVWNSSNDTCAVQLLTLRKAETLKHHLNSHFATGTCTVMKLEVTVT